MGRAVHATGKGRLVKQDELRALTQDGDEGREDEGHLALPVDGLLDLLVDVVGPGLGIRLGEHPVADVEEDCHGQEHGPALQELPGDAAGVPHE